MAFCNRNTVLIQSVCCMQTAMKHRWLCETLLISEAFNEHTRYMQRSLTLKMCKSVKSDSITLFEKQEAEH